MRIAFVDIYDADSVRTWSGTPYHMYRSLVDSGEPVEPVFPLRRRFPVSSIAKKVIFKARSMTYLVDHEPVMLRRYAAEIKRRLNGSGAEAILSRSSIPVSFLDSDLPITFWTDATFAGMVGFYDEYSRLPPSSIAHGHQYERAALDRCAMAFYSNDWAAKSAIENYGVSPEKVAVVPYGANVDHALSQADIRNAIEARPADCVNLIFIGVDWVRKGGSTAVDTVKALNEAGVNAKLTIIGAKIPEGTILPESVEYIPFLDKSVPAQRRSFEEKLLHSHFMVLPTRAECAAEVFSEAFAYGVPAIAPDVGGVSTLVSERSGVLLPPDAGANDYASAIVALSERRKDYTALALSAFDEYRQRLNWDVATQTIVSRLREVRDASLRAAA